MSEAAKPLPPRLRSVAGTPAARVVPVAVELPVVVQVVPVAVELPAVARPAVVRVVPVAVELLAVELPAVAAELPVVVQVVPAVELPVAVLSRLPAPLRVEGRPVRRSNSPLLLRRSRSRRLR